MDVNQRFDPEIQQLATAAQELGGLLHRYIAVHDRIFRFSLRRLVPIPGLFKAINFQQHFESLRFIEMDLQRVLEDFGRSALARSEAGERFLAYGATLSAAVAQLRQICGHLFQKADGTVEYTSSQYEHDLAEYNQRVARYRQLGARVNALFGR